MFIERAIETVSVTVNTYQHFTGHISYTVDNSVVTTLTVIDSHASNCFTREPDIPTGKVLGGGPLMTFLGINQLDRYFPIGHSKYTTPYVTDTDIYCEGYFEDIN